ncbi:zinc-binding alcohol dehydrogenase family protein [Curtobacterium ammoniigenes]|uniref:zinc-binding alcohol dehydrogenase family protein n=1 Tax=Curtobacterium ammoniigenes TaxID=395387 RepID=UPI00082C2F91|nr:zinc-binding alcohol dehydrogenase family protein [Curtobacterium ammoniigenes]
MNEALWLSRPTGRLRLASAPRTPPRNGEVLVRVRAVALNPVDAIPGIAHYVVTPWLRYPTVLGTDIAGDVVDVGPGVEGIAPGDRVLGFAAGLERSANRPAEGAFQRFAILRARVVTVLPPTVSWTEAATLPLGIATAAAALFEPDQLALELPTSDRQPERDASVLIWGGSTSVGCNAIQLATNAGYDVVTTASPKNAELVRSLGARVSVDYRDPKAQNTLLEALRGRFLAGTVAIGGGSLTKTIPIVRAAQGSGRLASAYPTPATRMRSVWERRRGVAISAIWGGSPVDTAVGPAIFRDFLGPALADGRYRSAPPARVVGSGLAAIPAGLDRLRAGVSAEKLVVVLDD